MMNLLKRTAELCRHHVGIMPPPQTPFSSSRRLLTTSQWKKYINILDVDRNSTPKDIKDSFVRLSKIYHPDNKLTGSHTKFVELKEAYDALKDGHPAITSEPSRGNIYGQTTHEQTSQTRPKPRDSGPVEPMNMKHIYQVYKTIKKQNEPEQPQFKPFENHHYPGTRFNRFEYTRFWDREAHRFVYVKKKSTVDYHRWLEKKHKSLRSLIVLFMVLTGVYTLAFSPMFLNGRFLSRWLNAAKPENRNIVLAKEEGWHHLVEDRKT